MRRPYPLHDADFSLLRQQAHILIAWSEIVDLGKTSLLVCHTSVLHKWNTSFGGTEVPSSPPCKTATTPERDSSIDFHWPSQGENDGKAQLLRCHRRDRAWRRNSRFRGGVQQHRRAELGQGRTQEG